MYRKLILCVSLVCFGAINLAAQQQKAVEPIQSADPRFDELRSKGFDALYNLEYDGARRYFKEMVRLFPAHPAGPQFLAATLWTETLNESRRLQASLYNTESFYAKNEDKVDPKIIAEFNVLTKQARILAEARLKANPKDVEALYFLGAIEGLKAAFAGAVQRSFMTALREGQRSVGHHRDVLKLDPQFSDAELTIGLYDYVVGQLPLPVKILASLTGNRGSKRRGLETLQRVAREAKWARDDANVVLIALFKREGRFNDALAVTHELGTKYPRNFLFKLEAADALVSQAAVDRTANPTLAASEKAEAIKILDALLRDRAFRTAAGKSLDLIHFRYGEALLTSGQAEPAAKEFLASAAVPNAQAGLATMALLRAAQALDIAGKRAEALSKYRAVLSRPDVYDAHDEARDGLQKPYKLHTENRTAGTEAAVENGS